MRRYFTCIPGVLLVLGLSVTGAFAEQSEKPVTYRKTLPPVLKEIEKKYSAAGSIETRFEQVTESAHMKQKKRSSGTITIKIPDKIRWETTKPDRNLLVSNGKKFWFYTPPFDEEEPGQVIERPGGDVRSRLASALMTGSFSAAQKKSGMRIVRVSPSEYTLLPKKGSAGTVKRAEIEVDLQEKLIRKVTIHHADGNTAEISLSQIQLGKPVSSETFNFVPPPNTDVVKE